MLGMQLSFPQYVYTGFNCYVRPPEETTDEREDNTSGHLKLMLEMLGMLGGRKCRRGRWMLDLRCGAAASGIAVCIYIYIYIYVGLLYLGLVCTRGIQLFR